MFSLTKEAVAYIKKNGGHAIITIEYITSIGGWACKGEQLWGSYVPNINIGKAEEGSSYHKEEHDGATIWYNDKLSVKRDFDAIQIRVKSIIVAKWLEMDGAQGLTLKPEGEAAAT